MKYLISFLFIHILVSCSSGKERNFTGSTPAGSVVRSFLGIPGSDSVDFIRWKLTLEIDRYQLSCNYGIGKPNTNGFYHGGRTVELSGTVKKENSIYTLNNGDKSLSMAELNEDLLHILNGTDGLLVGNGGWSYTLNSLTPRHSEQLTLKAVANSMKDSIVFEGRTPCGIPGLIPAGTDCYKLKWLVVLYQGDGINGSGRYKVLGTAWREQGGRTGNWQLARENKDRLIYHLNDENGKTFLRLLKLDDQVLIFTDAEGRLLVGNEDFSYTLNRRI